MSETWTKDLNKRQDMTASVFFTRRDSLFQQCVETEKTICLNPCLESAVPLNMRNEKVTKEDKGACATLV